jgi:hypothetical protein
MILKYYAAGQLIKFIAMIIAIRMLIQEVNFIYIICPIVIFVIGSYIEELDYFEEDEDSEGLTA